MPVFQQVDRGGKLQLPRSPNLRCLPGLNQTMGGNRTAGAERLRADFTNAHRLRNGFALDDHEIEVVTLRVAATAPAALSWNDLALDPEPGEPRRGERVSSNGTRMTRWWRPALREGSTVEGPALIEEAEATTFIDRSETARVLGDGTLEITWT